MDPKRLRQLVQNVHARCELLPLQCADIGSVDLRARGQFLLGQTQFGPSGLEVLCEDPPAFHAGGSSGLQSI